MVSFGATETAETGGKLLKGLVGAWGFEPQTPYRVKVVLEVGPTLLPCKLICRLYKGVAIFGFF